MATSDDPLGRAQDVKRCQVCPGKDRKSAAETVCNSCHINLCKTCIGPHMISDPNIKHDVVTFAFKKSEIISPKCQLHREKNCEIFCHQCNSSVCLKCLTSGSHENHEVQKISEFFTSRRNAIIKDNVELKNNIAPVYESIISEIEIMLSKVDQNHRERHKTIIEFGEIYQKLVKSVIEKYLNDSKEIEKKDTESLQALKAQFQGLQSLTQSAINKNESILASNDSSRFIHYVPKNEELRYVPPRFELTVPKFNPVKPVEQTMCQMIGAIPKSIESIIQGHVLKSVLPKARIFIDKPTVVRAVITGYGKTNAVNCIPNTNEFYISGDSKIIKHMNIKGKLLKEIPTKSGGVPSDLAVTRKGCLVYTESKPNGFNIMKNGGIESHTSLKIWTPRAICYTSTDEYLLALRSNDILNGQSKVVRYYGSTVRQEIQYTETGEHLFSDPWFIAENKNCDIIVSDFLKNLVVVVNKTGEFKFNYDGNLQSKKYREFKPCGVTTDSMWQILIADSMNNVIHIIDYNGQFLRYIDNCELESPLDLSTDSDDMLFVTELVTVKQINYLDD